MKTKCPFCNNKNTFTIYDANDMECDCEPDENGDYDCDCEYEEIEPDYRMRCGVCSADAPKHLWAQFSDIFKDLK